MSNCKEVQAKFTDWIFDELSASEIRDLQLHVEHCSSCASVLEQCREVHRTLASQLLEKELPAHLEFMWGKPRGQFSGLRGSFWRATALAGIAAVVFLAITLTGYVGRRTHPLTGTQEAKAALTQAQVNAMIQDAMEQNLARERKEFEVANQKLAASLRQQRVQELASVAAKLQYLEATQSAVWKESQQQGALVELIARNSLPPDRTQSSKP
jgi:hypothetical protein